MKVASLFSGCGGLDLGLTKAGHEIIMQVEIDPRCRQVLRHHFPGTLLHTNVEQVQTLPRETEAVAAGFPCQDLSPESNTRKGLKGTKTSMVRHVFRLLKASHPVQWVVLENVPGLLDRIHGEPAMMAYIAEQLEALGYSWAYRIINTTAFGDPQRRRRVFVVACLHGDPRDALLAEAGSCGGPCLKPCVLCWETGKDLTQEVHAMDLEGWRSGGCVGVMPTLTKSNGSRWMIAIPGSPTPPGLLAIEDAERLQGFDAGHTWPCIRLEAISRDLTPDAHEKARFALVGDAVSVPVAWYVGKRIANPYRGPKYMCGETDKAFDATAQEVWPRAAWRLAGDAAPREANGLLTRGALAELPQLLPFTPLSKFLTAIRPGLDQADIRDYVRRLKDNRFELSQTVQLKLIRTYGMKLNDFQAYPRTAESVVWASLKGWRPKWYPALLQSRSHASAAVLAQEEKGTTLVVFKGEQNKWSSLWVEEVVPWTDRRPEEISDKMDRPQEYARIVDWARAEHDWLCRFDEKGGYKDGAVHVTSTLKRKLDDAAPASLSSSPAGLELVGRTVEVYWPQDNTFYQGFVQSYNQRNKRPYKIYYPADQTIEYLDLTQEQWRLLPSAPEKDASPPILPGKSTPSIPSTLTSLPSLSCEGSPIGSWPVGSPERADEQQQTDSKSDPVEGPSYQQKMTDLPGTSPVQLTGCADVQQTAIPPPETLLGEARGLSPTLPQFGPKREEGRLAGLSVSPSSKGDSNQSGLGTTSPPPASIKFPEARALLDEISGCPSGEPKELERTRALLSGTPPAGSPSFSGTGLGAGLGPLTHPLAWTEDSKSGSFNTPPGPFVVDQLSRPDSVLSPDPASPPVNQTANPLFSQALASPEQDPGVTPLQSNCNPFRQNVGAQEASWKAGLSVTEQEKPAKQKRARQAPAPKARKVITEAALIKNPALDGAALVGREVRVLDVQTRKWWLATVLNFDPTVGFRNTQPWLVRHSDGSAEFVNLCLDRCQVLPLKSVEPGQAKRHDDNPPEARVGTAKEACLPSIENRPPELPSR